MLGLGTGAIVLPLLAHRLITSFGWRGAYASIGVLLLIISVPVVGFVLKESPEKLGYRPDGATIANPPAGKASRVAGVTSRQAWRDQMFWTMSGAFFLVGASVHGCAVHLAPMLTDRGITAERAALASSVLGGALLIGRVGSGCLLDRFFAPRVATLFFGGVALYVLAGALGPWLMGLGFDRTGSYHVVLAGFLAATAVAATMMLRLGPHRYHPR